MRKYAAMLQRAATLCEMHYYNELFCNYYEDEDICAFVQQHDNELHAYMCALAQEDYTHFVNVLFAVLRYNERCAS